GADEGAEHAVLAEAAIAGRALAIGAFQPELVARIPRQVQHDAGDHRPTPLVVGLDAGPGRWAEGDRLLRVVAGEVAANLMRGPGDLRRAPRLVHAQRADDVGNLLRRIVTGRASAADAERSRSVADVVVGRESAEAAGRIAGAAPGVRAREGAERHGVDTRL